MRFWEKAALAAGGMVLLGAILGKDYGSVRAHAEAKSRLKVSSTRWTKGGSANVEETSFVLRNWNTFPVANIEVT